MTGWVESTRTFSCGWDVATDASLYATDLLRAELNDRRPAAHHPQVDARLWTHFRTTHWPHHLTRTTTY